MLCALEMKAFEKGTAVDVRGGVEGKDRDGEE
jgi:archaeosine-15-forming tRNA-guanine transglycosylase